MATEEFHVAEGPLVMSDGHGLLVPTDHAELIADNPELSINGDLDNWTDDDPDDFIITGETVDAYVTQYRADLFRVGKGTFDYVLGIDLFNPGAGTFESGIYSWTTYGNNTIENDNKTLKITYVDNVTGGDLILRDSNDLTANLVVGQRYRLDFDSRVNTGSAVLRVGGLSVSIDTAINWTSFVTTTVYFTAQYALSTYLRVQSMHAGEIVWLDNLVLRPADEGTHSWIPYGNNTLNIVNNALEITYVDNSHGARLLLRSAFDITEDIIPGQQYRLDLDIKVSSGGDVRIAVNDGAGGMTFVPVTETIMTAKTIIFTAADADPGGGIVTPEIFVYNLEAGDIVTLDNLILRTVTSGQARMVSDGTSITMAQVYNTGFLPGDILKFSVNVASVIAGDFRLLIRDLTNAADILAVSNQGWTVAGNDYYVDFTIPALCASISLTWSNYPTGPTDYAISLWSLKLISEGRINTGIPTVDNASLGQHHDLIAQHINTGAPTVDNPIITQHHVLVAQDVIAVAPIVDLAIIHQNHILIGQNITTGLPTIDAAVIHQSHILFGQDIIAGNPLITLPYMAPEILIHKSCMTIESLTEVRTIETLC